MLKAKEVWAQFKKVCPINQSWPAVDCNALTEGKFYHDKCSRRGWLMISQKCSRRNFLPTEIWFDQVTVNNPTVCPRRSQDKRTCCKGNLNSVGTLLCPSQGERPTYFSGKFFLIGNNSMITLTKITGNVKTWLLMHSIHLFTRLPCHQCNSIFGVLIMWKHCDDSKLGRISDVAWVHMVSRKRPQVISQ